MMSLRSSLLFVGLLFQAAPVSAAEPKIGVDLKDGSSVRGEVVEREPGKSVTLLLATGEVRTIEWAKISRIDDGAAAHEAKAADAPSPSDDGVAVHVTAEDSRVVLQKRVLTVATDNYTRAEAWEDVCSAPCGQKVPRDQTFRIGGQGLIASDPFRLYGDTDLDVQAGSANRRFGGMVLGGVGAALVGSSVAFLALDMKKTTLSKTGNTLSTEPMVSPGVTYALLGTGVAALATGIILWATGRTSVRDGSGRIVGRISPRGELTF